MTKKTLYLMDVSSLFFRAYYAISNNLSSPEGLPTNALYGFLSMTDKFLKQKAPKYLVYCFDHEKPSFRTKIYPEYKAQRKETPEDLKVQIPYIKQMVSCLGIPMIERADYEADDLIGSLATLAQKKDFKVVIVSGDKDFAQLVNPDVQLYDPMKDVVFAEKQVQEKWGVKAQQMNDYLALVGDASDNIPGVLGIGPKGAQKLLNTYPTLESIYQNLNQIQKPLHLKLKKSEKLAFVSQKLSRIVTNLDLSVDSSFVQLKPFKIQDLRALLKKLGFKSFEKKLCGPDTLALAKPVKKLSSNLKLHTMGWEEFKSFIPAYGQVWVFEHKEKYFFAHKNKVIDLTPTKQETENQKLKKVGLLFSEKKVKWLGYDLKTLWHNFNCPYAIPKWCTMMALYLVESKPQLSFLDACSTHLKELVEPSLEPGEVYQLHKRLKTTLEKELSTLNMTTLFEEVELKLISVLYEMEKIGIKLNPDILKQQSKETTANITQVEKEIFKYTKHEFNISSPKQLSDILFVEMGLKPTKKIKTGYSTDVEALNKLKKEHPIIPLILQQRELFKLKTTYIDALPNLIKKETGRVHTHFRQALTVTGRLSSAHPNLQNIPIKTQRGRKIRQAFVAEKGKKIISADYSQIELRVLAHITGDPALCQAFQKDLDIHSATASEIYSVPLEKVTFELRRAAKAINFGLIYGQGPYTLSESLGISLAQAKEIIKNYFKKFKGVKEYMDSTVQLAREKGYVETLFGRRRYIAEFSSARFHTKKWAERAAINAPIQGTASDLVKLAMIELHQSLYSPILIQIHDEMLFECKTHLLEEETAQIKHIMENVVNWKVPLKAHIYIADSWSGPQTAGGEE